MNETRVFLSLFFSAKPEREIKRAAELSGARDYVRKDSRYEICIAQLVKKIRPFLRNIDQDTNTTRITPCAYQLEIEDCQLEESNNQRLGEGLLWRGSC
jgi:hypothetical protein